MTELPSGMLTFLCTDIEESTPRWEADPAGMRDLLTRHDTMLAAVISRNQGAIFKNTGDGVMAVFTSPDRAASAAIEAQRALQTDDWGGGARLMVRMGLHIGEATPMAGDYHGQPINWAARVMDLANGDQIAVSSRIAAFLDHFELHPVGDHQLKGIGSDTISLLWSPELVTDTRPLRSRRASAVHLPVQAQHLIGRTREVDELCDLLPLRRAITVVGPGGVGKTHLVIELAHKVAGDFVDGAVLCNLEPVDDDSVADAVAEALGARIQPGMDLIESIVNYLEGRELLLVLDNCEHVVAAVRELGERILELKAVRILATSREPVGFPGEQLFGLHPLDAATDGVQLFLERAGEHDRSFQPTDEDLVHIGEICERLDGIPLGIEVAAAWVRVLSPAELVGRLEDRFRTLRGGRAGSRSQTLRDAVQWSYEQLDPAQSELFDRLSIFSGGFSLDAVEAVCSDDDLVPAADIAVLMRELVDKSLLDSQRAAGHTRFTMLGTIRQFGQEQLTAGDRSDRFRQRHADYYATVVARQESLLISSREPDVWDLLDRDWSNLRSAFDTLLEAEQIDRAADFVLGLGWFSALSMRFETFGWVDEVVAVGDLEGHRQAASLLGMRALGAYLMVDDSAVTLANRGLELDQRDRYGFCRVALAAVALNNAFNAEASEVLTADWCEQVDDSSPASSRLWAEGMRVFHFCSQGDPASASPHAIRLQELAIQSGSGSAMALAHWSGGMVATFSGIDLAMQRWDRGLDVVRSFPAAHLIEHLIVGLELHFTASRGELGAVLQRCLDSLEQARTQHYIAGTSHLFGVTAIVLSRCGRADTGSRLLRSMTAIGHVPRPNAVAAVERALGSLAVDEASLEPPLSINDAATLAISTLRSALNEHEALGP